MSTEGADQGPLPADPERARRSMARLMDIYREMSVVADDLFTRRCPYKDRRSRCTAKFDCRNQFFVEGDADGRAICTGSDKLDYRKAWEA